MPSQTFYNLPKEKQNKLLKASIKEFKRVSFNDASINNIINDANISRGSFYMYFKDKDDLFKYILNFHKENFECLLKQILIKNKGNLKETFQSFLDGIYDYIHKYDNYIFFKNVFLNLNNKNKDYIIPIKKDCNGFEKIRSLIDISDLNINKEDDIQVVFDILIHITVPTIIDSLVLDTPKDELIEKYNKMINLIFKGIYRKDDYQ